MVKTVTEGLKMLPEAAGRGHSFSPYGPTLNRQITCLFFPCSKLGMQPITNGRVCTQLCH